MTTNDLQNLPFSKEYIKDIEVINCIEEAIANKELSLVGTCEDDPDKIELEDIEESENWGWWEAYSIPNSKKYIIAGMYHTEDRWCSGYLVASRDEVLDDYGIEFDDR